MVVADPWASPEALLAANPAAKVPSLVLDSGRHLIESACISDYLIDRSGRSELAPQASANAEERLHVLGLGRAAVDCAVATAMQRRFVPNSPLAERWLQALPRIARSLDEALRHQQATDGCDLADFTVAVAFDYIDFRLPEVDWRSVAPRLAARVRALAKRPSLARTKAG